VATNKIPVFSRQRTQQFDINVFLCIGVTIFFTILFCLSCRYKWYHYTININWPITT